MNGYVPRKALKTSFRASPKSFQPVYTGGPVLLTNDGQWLITTLGEEVLISEISTGLRIAMIKGDTTAITSLALSYHTSPPTLITAHLSTVVRYYPLPDSLPLDSASPPFLTYTRQLPKAHNAPILVSTISPDNTLLATGSSDGVVKVWDLEGGYVTHLFRGHNGPVSALRFNFPSTTSGEERKELITGSTDAKVRIFDLKDSSARVVGGGSSIKPKAVLEGHVSVIRGIDVTDDGKWAITGGRDKVVLVWDLSSTTSNEGGKKETGKGKGKSGGPKVVQTIICQEQVESLGLLTNEKVLGKQGLICWTGGDKGVVRIWDVLRGEEVGQMKGVEGVDEVEVDEDEQRGIISVVHDRTTSSLVSVHADQNLIFHSLSTGSATRQVIGFNDEIIDAAFLTLPSSSSSPSSSASTADHTHLALATNSNLIRLYSTSTYDSRLLSGHKDMVLCLDTTPDHRWLVSGSKDHTARIWAANPQGELKCIAICEGHAESVGAVAISRKREGGVYGRFLFTASQDRTIKMWDLSDIPLDVDASVDGFEPYKPKSLATLRIHEKDINSLDLSPNDKLLASGSQDKLVKVFEVDFAVGAAGGSGAVRHVGTCKGHRRGVWTVKFSKTDKVLASGAADRTVRLWNLDDFTCLKTFEGHTNSVLRVDFLTQGMQLITSASDGLVKLWNIKDEECIKTLDNHEDKIWALAISEDEKTIVSAGADSVATFWEDSTEIEQEEKNEAIVKAVQSEQDFTNYLALKDYRRAIQLALSMSQPGRLLSLFNTVISSSDASNASILSLELDEVIRTMSSHDLVRLLKHVRDWNTNARTSPVAQTILHAILKLRTPDDLLAAFQQQIQAIEPDVEEEEEAGEENEDGPKSKKRKVPPPMSFKDLMDGLIPYSERHFARIDRLVKESYMLDYVVGEMDGGLFGAEVMEV